MWKEKGLDEFDSETQDAPAIVEETVPDGCEAARTNIPGSVWKVLVEDGQKVREGDTLVILESMKWNSRLRQSTAESLKKYI